MKVFVTGVNGQLGHDIMLELVKRGYEAIGSGSGDSYRGTDEIASLPYVSLDITDMDAVRLVIGTIKPDAVIHCSAWTAVDAAEEPENFQKVTALNVKGPENIAKACKKIGAKLIYLSTDYVFSGEGNTPWKPDDRCFAPLNVYGESKLAGEFAVSENTDRFFIVRIAWVFGKNGKNFVRTMLNVAKTHDTVRVVYDQIGTPTYTADLARLLVDMAEKEIYRQAGLNVRVIPVTTEEYGISKAKRPFNSRLDKSKLTEAGFTPLPDWKDALRRFLSEIS